MWWIAMVCGLVLVAAAVSIFALLGFVATIMRLRHGRRGAEAR
jgi:hypothetical protein